MGDSGNGCGPFSIYAAENAVVSYTYCAMANGLLAVNRFYDCQLFLHRRMHHTMVEPAQRKSAAESNQQMDRRRLPGQQNEKEVLQLELYRR